MAMGEAYPPRLTGSSGRADEAVFRGRVRARLDTLFPRNQDRQDPFPIYAEVAAILDHLALEGFAPQGQQHPLPNLDPVIFESCRPSDGSYHQGSERPRTRHWVASTRSIEVASAPSDWRQFRQTSSVRSAGSRRPAARLRGRSPWVIPLRHSQSRSRCFFRIRLRRSSASSSCQNLKSEAAEIAAQSRGRRIPSIEEAALTEQPLHHRREIRTGGGGESLGGLRVNGPAVALEVGDEHRDVVMVDLLDQGRAAGIDERDLPVEELDFVEGQGRRASPFFQCHRHHPVLEDSGSRQTSFSQGGATVKVAWESAAIGSRGIRWTRRPGVKRLPRGAPVALPA